MTFGDSPLGDWPGGSDGSQGCASNFIGFIAFAIALAILRHFLFG
jgi:hypothetical protein